MFVPLARVWWERYADGTKRVEWRAYGPRWNRQVAFPGRAVTLSLGYSGPRLAATVVRTRRVSRDDAPAACQDMWPHASHFCAIWVSVDIGPPTYS
jgi:hypothetical protein